MPEREEGSEACRLVEAVADEHLLPVDDPALHPRIPVTLHAETRRPVLHPGRERDRQAPRGLGGAGDDVGQGIGPLLAGVPGHEDGGGALGPGHLDGRARVDHARSVRGLASRTASTSSRCRPGNDRSGRSCPSDSHSPLDPTTTTETSASAAARTARSNSSPVSGGDAPIARPEDGGGRRPGPHLDGELVGVAGCEVDGDLHRLASCAVEAGTTRWFRVVDEHVAIQAQHRAPGALQPEPPRAGHVRREAAADAHGTGAGRQTRPRRTDPHDPGRVRQPRLDGRRRCRRRFRVVEVLHREPRPDEAHVDRGQPALDAAAHLRGDDGAGQPLGQRVGHAATSLRRDLGAAPAHRELARVRPDHRDARDVSGVEGQEPVVDQEHRPLGGHLARHGPPGGVVLLELVRRRRPPEDPDPLHQPRT